MDALYEGGLAHVDDSTSRKETRACNRCGKIGNVKAECRCKKAEDTNGKRVGRLHFIAANANRRECCIGVCETNFTQQIADRLLLTQNIIAVVVEHHFYSEKRTHTAEALERKARKTVEERSTAAASVPVIKKMVVINAHHDNILLVVLPKETHICHTLCKADTAQLRMQELTS